MRNCLYTDKNFRIYRAGSDFILHNRNKNFKEAHTHIKSFVVCRWTIYSSNTGELPEELQGRKDDFTIRFLTSLLRVCTLKHKRKFQNILDDILEMKIN